MVDIALTGCQGKVGTLVSPVSAALLHLHFGGSLLYSEPPRVTHLSLDPRGTLQRR